MNSPVQQIKERLSIEEVVSSYIKLEQSGRNLKARCPFHQEKTPSFFVSPDRGGYYCFGCSAKGDIFTFVQEFEGLDFKGALKLLASKAGVILKEYDPKEESEKDRLFSIMESATAYFEGNLSSEGKALEYLKSRGLEEKTVSDFRIGYALPQWRALHTFLKSKGFSDADIQKAGLIKRNDSEAPTGNNFYDRFRGRIMFPISDSSGRVIAFSGRNLIDEEESAKYINSPETPIFSKSYVLYGLDKAKESIRKNNFSILVEGQMDLILSHQAGFRNTIASSGTALSDATVSKENVVSNLGVVHRLSNNIVIAFDSDSAGVSAAGRAASIALALGMDVKVASIPESLDPADLIVGRGKDAWREAIRNSVHVIEFTLNKILERTKDERAMGREIKKTLLPLVSTLPSSIEKAHFLKKISSLSGIPEHALEEDLREVDSAVKSETEAEENKREAEREMRRKDYILRRLLGLILWQENLSQPLIDTLEARKEIQEILGMEAFPDASADTSDMIFEAEVFYQGRGDLNKEIRELLLNLKEEYLRERLSNKMRELHIAEESQDSAQSATLFKEYQDLRSELEKLKDSHFNN